MSSPYSGPDWPAHFNTNVIVGRFVGSDGSVISGQISFTPRPVALVSVNDQTTVVPATIAVKLDVNGNLLVTLPVTDDPDIQPTRWTYAVVEEWSEGRSYDISVPSSPSPLNLLDLAPMPSSVGTINYAGPPGAPGSPMIFTDNGDGTYTVSAADFVNNGDGTFTVQLPGGSILAPTINYPRLAGALQASANLADLTDVSAARANLGITAGGGGTGAFTLTDNGDGTTTLVPDGSAAITDNGDQTSTLTGTGFTITDNGDQTSTIG